MAIKSGAQVIVTRNLKPLPASDLEPSDTEGSQRARHATVMSRGGIAMWSTRISGRLFIRNATIEPRADAPKSSFYGGSKAIGTALSAPRLSVGADVMIAEGCEVTGRIDMSLCDMSSFSIGPLLLLRFPAQRSPSVVLNS